MKKVWKLLAPLMVAVTLRGCTGGTTVIKDEVSSVGSVSNVTSTKIQFSTQKAKGLIVYQINVKEGQSLVISSSVKVSEGSISVKITDLEGFPVYSDVILSSSDYEITLQNYAKYKFQINHDSFKGSYSFSWAAK